ncbi:hypothetical protein GCM10010170_075830 [Dactylosporangium salmoneum]|uniref:Uncharacterized protein n=1 Tax=Dactylosporangium salmoneum TaxID=53361 RepID=A0ABP5UB82_9ACTN
MRATGQVGSVQDGPGAGIAASVITPPDELLFETIMPYGRNGFNLQPIEGRLHWQ